MLSGKGEGEDLFGYGQDAGGSTVGSASPSDVASTNAPGFQYGHWGGDAGHAPIYDEQGNIVDYTQSGVQKDVDRYRQKGQAAADRSAFRGNYAGFNDAGAGFSYGQGRARGAMDLQQAAAEGRAPSAAEIAGKAAIGQSLDAQMAASASSRGGPLAAAAAGHGARNQADAFRQTAIQGIQAGRANEMASARNAYAGSTFQYGQNQMGQQGLQLGKTQQEIQAEQFQRQLNQQGEQFYENKGFDTKTQGLASDFARSGQQFQAAQSSRQEDRADDRLSFDKWKGAVDSSTDTMKLGVDGSDVRMKNPIQAAGPSRTIDLDEDDSNTFDADDYDRRMADSGDIQRRDPYEADEDEYLTDRQQQSGQQAPARWLDAYIEKDQAPPPPTAQRPRPKMSHDAGWANTAQDDADRGMAPGTTDLDRYAYSDAVTKIVGKVNEFFSDKKDPSPAPAASPPPAKVDNDPKFDWDAEDRKAAEEPRRKSTERTFRRDTKQDQKKVRRTFEDKASKDADAMMAGMNANLARGPSAGPRETVDLDDKDDGRLVYSDKEAKKAAFEAGKKAALKPSAQKSIDPITVEGRPRNYQKAGVPTGPTKYDDEIFNMYSQGKGPISPQQYMDNVESSERWEDSVRAARDKPVNLQGDSYVPPSFQPPGPGQEEDRMSYSDKRTKTEAAHALEGHDYAYKGEFTPPEQEEGEPNHGPMAQAMEKNPLTRTAVKKDPRGMRMVDMNKLVKVHSSLIDHLQDEIEGLKGARHG